MISVLIATYNGSAFLIDQLDSIRDQIRVPDEVIICDDFSTDNTVEMLKNYIKENQLNNWEVHVNEKNEGHYKTFLKLAELSKGEYVFFADQDDIWEHSKIHDMTPVFDDESVSMVFCKSRFIDEERNTISTPETTSEVIENSIHNQLTNWPSGYQTAIRKDVLKDILFNRYDSMDGFDFHDVLFGLVSPIYGKVMAIDSILDNHRIHQNNVTRSVETKSFLASKKERCLYVKKIVSRMQSLEVISIEKNSKYQKIIKDYKVFNEHRISFLTKFSLKRLVILFRKRQLYPSNKDFISDIIYSLNLSKIARKMIEVRNK